MMSRKFDVKALFPGLVLAGLILIPAGALIAQEDNNRCEGIVTDDAGAPLAGVEITFKNIAKSVMAQSVKTNKKGRYSHNFLPVAMSEGLEIRAAFEGLKMVQIAAFTSKADGTKITTDTYMVGQSQAGLHAVMVPPQSRSDITSKAKCVVDFVLAPEDRFTEIYKRLQAELAAKEGKTSSDAGAESAAAPDSTKGAPAAPVAPAAAAGPGPLQKTRALIDERKYAEAIAPGKEAVAASPESAEAHLYLGRALLQVENLAEAEPILKKGLELDPSMSGLNFDMAMLFIKKGRLMQAIPYLEKERELNPEAPSVLSNLGKLYVDTSQFDKAVALYESLITLSPDNVENYGMLADAYKQVGNAGKEMETYKRMGAQDSSGMAFYNLGNMMFNKNEMVKAADAYQRAIAQSPGNAAAHYQLGLVYVNLAKFKEAVVELDTFVKLSPKDPKATEAKSLAADLRKMGG